MPLPRPSDPPLPRSLSAYRQPVLTEFGPVARRTLGGSGAMPETIMIGPFTIMLTNMNRYP